MDGESNAAQETENLRLSKDIKSHNWLLNKMKNRQDLTIKKGNLSSVPVSLSLDLLNDKTKTFEKDICTFKMTNSIPTEKIETFPGTALENIDVTIEQTPEKDNETKSIKHNLPITLLPNRERYSLTKIKPYDEDDDKLLIQSIIRSQKNTVGTQTREVNILSDEEYTFYQKCKRETIIDLTSNASDTDSNKTDLVQFQKIPNHIALDETSMNDLLKRSEEFKKVISNMTASVNRIYQMVYVKYKEVGLHIDFEKREKMLNMVENIISKLFGDIDRTLTHSTTQSTSDGSNQSNIEQELLIRRRAIETMMNQAKRANPSNCQQENGSNQIAHLNNDRQETNSLHTSTHANLNTSTHANLNTSTHANFNNITPNVATASPKDPRLNRVAYCSQTKDRRYDTQFHNYMKMVQRHRASVPTCKNQNATANAQTQFRNTRNGWPYPVQYHEMQQQATHLQMHQSQYVQLNPYQEQRHLQQMYYQPQQASVHKDTQQQTVQQNVMYDNNNMYQ